MAITCPKSRPDDPWLGFIVLTADDIVRGVFGLSMRHAARAQAAKLKRWEPEVKIQRRKLVKPPKVGDHISKSQVAI
jgi:hypothetical protein